MSLDQQSLDSLKIDRGARPDSRSAPRWRILIAALLIGGTAAAWWMLKGQPVAVEIAIAVAAPGGDTARRAAVLDASGYVVARREATVSSKVTGKIADVLIEEGMTVEAGQIVARLDDQSLQPLLALAKSQLDARRTELAEVEVRQAEARRNLRRIEQLRSEALVSEADLDGAQAEVDALNARLGALASAVDVAQATVQVRLQDLDDLLVRAPFDGVIVSKDAQPGEMVSPMSAGGGFTRTGIATLVDMESREIEVDVNEAFINRVRAGQRTEATLDAYGEWRIPSHVINIVPTADRQKATVKVRIAFDELDARILPNMGIKVSFLEAAPDRETGAGASGGDSAGSTDGGSTDGGGNAARPAVRVPAAAVMRDGTTRFVWRLRNGTIERVAVLAGNERNGQIELHSGISAGDVIVARPVAGLVNGAAVRSTSP